MQVVKYHCAMSHPVCKTRWTAILLSTEGTQDKVRLSRLDKPKGSFPLYCRLRNQLLQRRIQELPILEDADDYPFQWDHAASNDFFFEDAMRCACEISYLMSEKAKTVKILKEAMVLLQYLLESQHVQKWQSVAVLPHWLRTQRLRAQMESVKIMYIETFFQDFVAKKHPIPESPGRSLEIIMWLSQKDKKYKPYLSWVRMEIMFQKARDFADENAMKSAMCFADLIESAPSPPSRALERAAYIFHFAKVGFPGISSNGHECEEVDPQRPFNAQIIFGTALKARFSWEREASKVDYVFTY